MSRHKTSVRFLTLFLLLVFSIGFCACAPMPSISTDPNDPNAEAFILKPIVKNPRLEIHPPEGSPSLRRSIGLWINEGEQIAVRWDEFSSLINDKNVTCNFERPGEGCKRCNACRTTDTPTFCPGGSLIVSPFRFVQLYKFSGFMSQMPPSETLNISPEDGCPASGKLITPDSNATYQLKLSPEFFGRKPVNEIESLTEARVRVIKTGGETVMYELSRFRDSSTSETFLKFSGIVPNEAGDVLRDNFSETLSIGKVRILKGTSGTNPVTGDFMLKDASVIKFSRIYLTPNFQGIRKDNIGCYAKYNENLPLNDGNLNMKECLISKTSSTSVNLKANPVYLESAKTDLLTWFVEFNQDDFSTIGGGELPTLEGKTLAIEFTIE